MRPLVPLSALPGPCLRKAHILEEQESCTGRLHRSLKGGCSMRDSDDSRPHASDPDTGEDLEEDPGEEPEVMIEQADRPFASESFGTTAEEQEEGEPLDQRLREERPDKAPDDLQLAIEDFDTPDDEKETVARASLEHEHFVAPE